MILRVLLGLFLFILPAKSWAQLESYDGADEHFSERRSKPLSEKEKSIVGKYGGENRELKWEIFRREDGTYDLIIVQEVDGEDLVDLLRGVWGIEGEQYYYMDLQSLSGYAEGEPEKMWETVFAIEEKAFVTHSEGEDGKVLESREEKLEEFRFPVWRQILK